MSRPASVTLLAFGVFCLAVFNLIGVINGILRYAFVKELPLTLSPAYLIITDALWSLAFGTMGFGLWRLKRWGRIGTLIVSTLYIVHGWFNRWVFSRVDYVQMTTPFALVMSVLSLGVIWLMLSRRSVRDIFSD